MDFLGCNSIFPSSYFYGLKSLNLNMSQLVHRISIHLNPSKSFINPVVPMNPMVISPVKYPMVNSNLCPVSLWLRCSDLRHTPRGWATSRVPAVRRPCARSIFIGRISIGSLDHFLFLLFPNSDISVLASSCVALSVSGTANISSSSDSWHHNPRSARSHHR